MRRNLLILFILCLNLSSIIYAQDSQSLEEDLQLPAIFIWQIPDSVIERTAEDEEILHENTENYSLRNEEEITVKGYLEYTEDTDAIYLKDDNKEFVLNLSVPQKFETAKATDIKKLPSTTFAQNVYARSSDLTYNIAPVDTGIAAKKGNFSVGTSYNESIDKSDLGFTTSFYTKYDNKYFSLSSSYNKESGVAYSMVIDKLSLTPELKLNKYLSIKDVMTSDITRNRKQNSVILSIKPTRDDRVRFEFGAGQTFDENREMIKTEVKFSTQFRW